MTKEVEPDKRNYDSFNLQPIVDLIVMQEERLAGKIDNIHEEVKEVKMELKRMNGNVKQNREDIILIQAQSTIRSETCGKVVDEMKVRLPLLRGITSILKHPKTASVLFILLLVTIQIIVQMSMDNSWLGKIWEYVKLIF